MDSPGSDHFTSETEVTETKTVAICPNGEIVTATEFNVSTIGEFGQ